MGSYADTGSATSGGVFWRWTAPGPKVQFEPEIVAFARNANSPITEIQTTSPAYSTPKGNRVGGRLDDFKAEFGPEYSVSRSLQEASPHFLGVASSLTGIPQVPQANGKSSSLAFASEEAPSARTGLTDRSGCLLIEGTGECLLQRHNPALYPRCCKRSFPQCGAHVSHVAVLDGAVISWVWNANGLAEGLSRP